MWKEGGRLISKLTDIVGRPNVGEGVVIEDYVAVGPHTCIGHHVVIHSGTIVGERVRIDDFTSLGKLPAGILPDAVQKEPGKWKFGVDSMRASTDDPAKRCLIGTDTVIGCGCVIYAGAHIGNCCTLGDRVIVREGAVIGDHAVIGSNAYLAAGAEIPADARVAVGEIVAAAAPGAGENRCPDETANCD